jgi:hypothetical protein
MTVGVWPPKDILGRSSWVVGNWREKRSFIAWYRVVVVRANRQCCFGDNCLASRILAAGTQALLMLPNRQVFRVMAGCMNIKRIIIECEIMFDEIK